MLKHVLATLVGLTLFVTAVCGQEKKLNVIFIPKSSDQVFWVSMRAGVDKAIDEVGNISLTWRGPSTNNDTRSQIQILKLYSRPGVDAIVIAPTDRQRLQEPIRQAAELGIKVVVVDSAVDGEAHRYFITTDNYGAGQLAAKQLSRLLDARGRVVVFRTVAGSASTDDRARGFIDYVAEHSPKIEIAADVYGGASRGELMRNATLLLDGDAKIDGIFAVNESSSDGVLRALLNKGLAGKTRFIAFDSTEFLLAGLSNRQIDGLIVQDPRRMGYLAIKAAVAAINNAAMGAKTISIDATMVTRDNLKDTEIRALLFP